MNKINFNIFTPEARHRFIVERDAHQIAEDATATTLLEDKKIRMGSGYTHVTYDTGIDLDAWDDESWADAWRDQKDNEFCPVCGHSVPHCECKR